MFKILIVEDDLTIAEAVAAHLRQWDYETFCCTDFKDVLAQFTDFAPHLVLLDISLPFFNGYHWCEEIRRISKVPVVFISSATDNMNIVMAMNMGGDDFIAKPFDLGVLTAKIQALLRRSYAFRENTQVLARGNVILNLNETTLVYKDQKLELTKNEFKVLQVLMERAGRVVSRTDLMTRLWESDQYIDDNTLTVNMTRLRKTLEDAGITDFITTKKGIGYIIP